MWSLSQCNFLCSHFPVDFLTDQAETNKKTELTSSKCVIVFVTVNESTLRMCSHNYLPFAGPQCVHSPLRASLSSPGVFLDTGTRLL